MATTIDVLDLSLLIEMLNPARLFRRLSNLSPFDEIVAGKLPSLVVRIDALSSSFSFTDIKEHIVHGTCDWERLSKEKKIAVMCISRKGPVFSFRLLVASKQQLSEKQGYAHDTPEQDNCDLYMQFLFNAKTARLEVCERGVHPRLRRKNVITEVSQQAFRPFVNIVEQPTKIFSYRVIHVGTVLYFITNPDVRQAFKAAFRRRALLTKNLEKVLLDYQRRRSALAKARNDLLHAHKALQEAALALPSAFKLEEDIASLKPEALVAHLKTVPEAMLKGKLGECISALDICMRFTKVYQKTRELRSSLTQQLVLFNNTVIQPILCNYQTDLESLLDYHGHRLSLRFAPKSCGALGVLADCTNRSMVAAPSVSDCSKVSSLKI